MIEYTINTSEIKEGTAENSQALPFMEVGKGTNCLPCTELPVAKIPARGCHRYIFPKKIFERQGITTHLRCHLSIRKTAEGQAQQAALLLMGLDHYVKLMIVVDEDINVSKEEEVLWAMATSTQADEDVTIIPGVLCNQLDPSSHQGTSAKMIIDATRPMQETAKRISVPEGAAETARKIIGNR